MAGRIKDLAKENKTGKRKSCGLWCIRVTLIAAQRDKHNAKETEKKTNKSLIRSD